MNFEKIKKQSEQRVVELGGKICDWLPSIELRTPRGSTEAARRALVLNAMLQIHLGAPVAVIAQWIHNNDLNDMLSRRERQILTDGDDALTEQDSLDLSWSIEALWAMAWAGGLVDELPIATPVGDSLASLMPNLQRNEDGARLLGSYQLRPHVELYRKLDLYYRAHWYAVELRLGGKNDDAFFVSRILERRKALGWLNDDSIDDWSNIELGT